MKKKPTELISIRAPIVPKNKATDKVHEFSDSIAKILEISRKDFLNSRLQYMEELDVLPSEDDFVKKFM